MPRIPGLMIETLTRSLVTVDGRHVVLQSRTADGNEVSLAIPREQISRFIDHLAFGASRTEEITRSGENVRMAAIWWNSAFDQKSGSLSLTLTFGQGGALCFDLSEHMAKALLTTLKNFYEADIRRLPQLGEPTPSEFPAQSLVDVIGAEQTARGFVDND